MNMRKYFELGMMTLLERKSIDSVTVSELIKEVGSCKGTFYKHYIDKYDLCCSCLKNSVYAEISTGAADWESFMYQLLASFEKYGKAVLHAFESSDVNSIRAYHNEFMLDFLTKLYIKNGGDVTSGTNRASLEMCCLSATDITVRWLSGGCKESKETVIRLLRAVMPQSIFKEVYANAA